MAEISLYLANVNITLNEAKDSEKCKYSKRNKHHQCSGVMLKQNASKEKEFECVELDEFEGKEKEKPPRRVIHFSSGETMEEYSTEEEDDTEKHPEKKDLLSSTDTSNLTWGPYVWFQMWRAATSTVSACDYLGEKMASLFGITSAKYQYAIDEYNRLNKEKEEQLEESSLSEETECHSYEQKEKIQEPEINQPEPVPAQNLNSTLTPSTSTTVSVPFSTVNCSL